MLVFTRKPTEKVIITASGEVIEVTVVKLIGSSRVRLGFKASSTVAIDREEIARDKAADGPAAA